MVHRGSITALVLALAFALAPAARAQAPVAAAAAFSASCAVPDADVATSGSLAGLGAKLKAGDPVKIMAIGSSSTVGIGASSRNHAYPSDLSGILAKALKGSHIEIINRGVSGEVAATTAQRIRDEVDVERPDLLLWQLGTNDALSRVPPDQFAETVNTTLDWLKENKIEVALIGLQYTSKLARDANYIAIRDVLFKIANERHILYIRRYAAMKFIARTRAKVRLLSPDHFHLNDLGYECMAEQVAHAVVASLFVKRFRPGAAK